MTVEIDSGAATCTLVIDQRRVVGALNQARITTDPRARMSVLELRDGKAHITEVDAQRLVAAGVKDERRNLVADG
ncbi:MAG: DUF3203 family protein [Pseudomonadota bacterium]